MGKLVTIPDTGRELGGVCRSRVYKLVDERELIRVKIGSRAFITRASIDAYLSRLTAEAS